MEEVEIKQPFKRIKPHGEPRRPRTPSRGETMGFSKSDFYVLETLLESCPTEPDMECYELLHMDLDDEFNVTALDKPKVPVITRSQ